MITRLLLHPKVGVFTNYVFIFRRQKFFFILFSIFIIMI